MTECDRCELDHKDGGVCLRMLVANRCPAAADHMQPEDDPPAGLGKVMLSPDQVDHLVEFIEAIKIDLTFNNPLAKEK